MFRKIRLTISLVLIFGLSLSFVGQDKGAIAEAAEKQKLDKVLNVYNWEDYLGPDTIANFEKEYGVKVNLEIYEEEQIMLSVVQSDPSKFDLIILGDRLVREMAKLRLLAPLDMENIPNFKNIGQRFKNTTYDPENKYSVAYLWGTTGIAYNTKYITAEEAKSWALLWNQKYKGKLAMLNNQFAVIGATLKYLGYSFNTPTREQVGEAREKLLEQKHLLKGYIDPINIMDMLVKEEIWAAQLYNGDALFAAGSNPDISFAIPEEGSEFYVDNVAIPRRAKHKYTAEVFINYILRPQVSADIANYQWYANANEAAKEFIDPGMLEDPSVYPPKEIMDKVNLWQDLGDLNKDYNRIWAQLRAKSDG